MLKRRMAAEGKQAQNQMIKDKVKVLKSVIKSSYFGADVVVNSNEENVFRAAIDLSDAGEGDKIISAPFENDLKIGDIIYWIKTNSYWIITYQEIGEIAFFQGKMEQCENYQILGPDGKTKVFANIKVVPKSATKDFDITKMNFDETTVRIQIPDNEINSSLFKIDTCIQIKGFTYKIKNVDNISTNGLIILHTERDFDNNPTLFVEKNEPENDNTYIVGPSEIVPLEEVTYTINGDIDGTWAVSENINILKTINSDNSLTISWTNPRKRKDFIISYGEYSKEIKVNSLF